MRIHDNFLVNFQFSHRKRPWVVLGIFYCSCFQQFLCISSLVLRGDILNDFQTLRDRDISHRASWNLCHNKLVQLSHFQMRKISLWRNDLLKNTNSLIFFNYLCCQSTRPELRFSADYLYSIFPRHNVDFHLCLLNMCKQTKHISRRNQYFLNL